MKLLFVHQHLGEFGGAETNLHLSAKELAARGHDVALAYQRDTGRGAAAWSATFRERFVLEPGTEAKSLAAILEQWAPDLIYIHTLESLSAVEALLRCYRPVVRMVHDHNLYCLRSYKYNYFTRQICSRRASAFCVFPCLASIGRSRGGRLPFQWRSYRAKRREILLNQQCDCLVVYSDYQRRELIRNGFDHHKIEICAPLGGTCSDLPVSSFDDRNLILFAGQLIRGKGVDQLVQALAKLSTPFECVILGDGHHRAVCEKLCKRLGLEDRVRFQGYVLPSDLGKYYLNASVFAMSSLWPEPFGLAGPEAMRYGLPVVAFDAGGIREWLQDGENGFLVPWGDTTAFAARLQELLTKKELAREMGRRARTSIRQFEAARQIDRLEEIFLKLVGRRGFVAPGTTVREMPLSAYD